MSRKRQSSVILFKLDPVVQNYRLRQRRPEEVRTFSRSAAECAADLEMIASFHESPRAV